VGVAAGRCGRGAEDEDGNARVSWLERRGGDRDYAIIEPPPPMETLAEGREVSRR